MEAIGNAALWYDEDLDNNTAFGTSGFNALPRGIRHKNGIFQGLGLNTIFCGDVESSNPASQSWGRSLGCYLTGVGRFGNYKGFGYSIRYIKDN
jgi:hypothetical protein